MKKFISLILAIILCLSLCLPALAADGEDAGYLMLAGENSKWTKGSKESILAAASGLYDDLSAVYMDGKPIDESSVDLFPTAIAVDDDETSNATAGFAIGFRAADTATTIPTAFPAVFIPSQISIKSLGNLPISTANGQTDELYIAALVRHDTEELIPGNANTASPSLGFLGIVVGEVMAFEEGLQGQTLGLININPANDFRSAGLPLLKMEPIKVADIKDAEVKVIEIKSAGAGAVNGGADEANGFKAVAIPALKVRVMRTDSENAKRILQLAVSSANENHFSPTAYEAYEVIAVGSEVNELTDVPVVIIVPGSEEPSHFGISIVAKDKEGTQNNEVTPMIQYKPGTGKITLLTPLYVDRVSGPDATGGGLIYGYISNELAAQLTQSNSLISTAGVSAETMSGRLPEASERNAVSTAFDTSTLIVVGIALDNANGGEAIVPEALGFTGIELKPEYLETLSVGKHTLTFEYKDGQTVSTEIEIIAANPETGDNMTALWISLCAVSLLCGAVILKKKAK